MGTVLDAPDKQAILLSVIDHELNELKYKRLSEWFAYLDRLVHLGCPGTDEIETLAEIKASRDVLAHNNGIVNAVYVAKAGSRARHKEGERLAMSEKYHRESWEAISKIVRDISEAAIGKARQNQP